MVQVILYGLTINNDVLNLVHNTGRRISEYYFPEEGISFNYVDDNVNIFRTSKDRYSSTNVCMLGHFEVSKTILDLCKDYLKIKEKLSLKLIKIAEDYN